MDGIAREEASTLLALPGTLPIDDYCSFIEIQGKEALRAEILRISRGRFETVEIVGRGGMADVWKTIDHTEDTIVALKTPHRYDEESGLGTVSDDAYHKRVLAFQQEALMAKALDHQHIVRATHIVLSLNNEICYYVTPFFPNGSLRDQLDCEELHFVTLERDDVRRITSWGICILDALCYLQEIGITHRDIKPANLFLAENDTMMLNDFGLAESTGPMNAGRHRRIPRQLKRRQPTSYLRAGTPSYMSPEQFVLPVHLLDQRSDIYSIGVLLYELLNVEHPFPETRKVWEHPQRVPPALRSRRPEVPEFLSDFVMSCLSLEREQRPQSPVTARKTLVEVLQRL